jgi:hypothetical protein
MFEPLKAFRKIAKTLNAMKRDSNAECFFECMSGGLVWTDECASWQVDSDGLGALRILWNYRTSLILENPRIEFEEVWNSALSLAPKWPGFLPEIREPRSELLALIPKPKYR